MIRKCISTLAAIFCLSCHAVAVELVNIGTLQQFVPTTEKPVPTSPEDWQAFQPVAPSDDGTIFLRQKIRVVLDDGEAVHSPLAMAMRLYGVYDFYWDGDLIGSNRHQGKQANQYSRIYLPVEGLKPGLHTLKVHITALGLKEGEGLNLYIQPAALKSDFFGVHPTVISTFFVATASFLVACYLIFLWRGGAKRPGLKAAIIINFAISTFIMLEEGKFLFSYPYLWQPYLDVLRAPITLLILSLLAWVTLTRLSIKKRIAWMAIVPLTLGLSLLDFGPEAHDIRAFSLLIFALLAISLYSLMRGIKRAALFSIGLVAALLALWLDPETKQLFLIVITVLLAADLGLDIRRQAKAAIHHALVSERLRADLIKRNIQPHFLMNSLTALMEWVETAPDSAIEFIDGLASEFRLLCDFAERSVITLGEELTLCNTHLRLMALRLNCKLELRTRNIDPNALIPPATFHTLIENAFTHNAYAGQNIAFELACECHGNSTTYVLTTPMVGTGSNASGSGIGSRYVRARLEEYCGNAFRFHAEQVGSDWKTTIVIGVAE